MSNLPCDTFAIHSTAHISADSFLQAEAGFQIIIEAGVCLGAGCCLHALSGNIVLRAGAVVGSNVLIVGWCELGEGCVVGHGSTLFEVAITAGQVLGRGAIVGLPDRSVTLIEPQANLLDEIDNLPDPWQEQPQGLSQSLTVAPQTAPLTPVSPTAQLPDRQAPADQALGLDKTSDLTSGSAPEIVANALPLFEVSQSTELSDLPDLGLTIEQPTEQFADSVRTSRAFAPVLSSTSSGQDIDHLTNLDGDNLGIDNIDNADNLRVNNLDVSNLGANKLDVDVQVDLKFSVRHLNPEPPIETVNTPESLASVAQTNSGFDVSNALSLENVQPETTQPETTQPGSTTPLSPNSVVKGSGNQTVYGRDHVNQILGKLLNRHSSPPSVS